MLEQLSQAVTYFAHYTASKAGKTGLTVTIDVWNPARSKIVTAAGATELGDGLYYYTLAGGNTGSVGDYPAVFHTADSTVDQQDIPALWVIGRAGIGNLDAAVSTRLATSGYTVPPTVVAIVDGVWDEPSANHLITGSTGQKLAAAGGASDPLTNAVPGSYAQGTAGFALGRVSNGQITTVSPVAQNGAITVVVGDDYKAADGRALVWTDTANTWPVLSGATVALTANNGTSISGSVLVATGSNKSVQVELTHAQSTAIGSGVQRFNLSVTLANGDVVTLMVGQISGLNRT